MYTNIKLTLIFSDILQRKFIENSIHFVTFGLFVNVTICTITGESILYYKIMTPNTYHILEKKLNKKKN